MATFMPATPLDRQIVIALTALREARRDGDATRIYVATRRLQRKLDLLPSPTRTLAEIDPALDMHLRVAFTFSPVRNQPP